MGRSPSTREWDTRRSEQIAFRDVAETRRASLTHAAECAEIERNATPLLAQAISRAFALGWSVREIATATGLSKSRVDRLRGD
jgi:hypothetical protein